MKKILLITTITPTLDNYNGPSALLFHLLKQRPNDIDLEIISTNQNKVDTKHKAEIENELKTQIQFLKKDLFNRLRTSNKINRLIKFIGIKHKLPIDSYYKLPPNIIQNIHKQIPDLIWLYPHSLISVAKQLRQYKILVTGPDCSSLHYSRVLRDSYTFYKKKYQEDINKLSQKIVLEQEWGKLNNSIMHLVGMTDTDYFNTININTNYKAYFFPHPHYSLTDKKISLNKDIIKIIITGKFDLYTYSDINSLINEIIKDKNNIIKENYEFTFLGKSWIDIHNKLQEKGFKTNLTTWVDNYINFIKDFDIQIFPISIGSGTKGKVLDALSTGLLCIGSKYAFENTAIMPNQSCLIYKNTIEILDFLEEILLDRNRFEKIAVQGKENIRKEHNPSIIINKILEFTFKCEYEINRDKYFYVDLK